MITIPFNRPYMNGRELYNIAQAHINRGFAGDGQFTRTCQERLAKHLGVSDVFLTQSGTAALEAALLALSLAPGSEVILPSFTFVSCANAVLIAGGRPVFADINPETKTICLNSIKRLVCKETRAVIIVHYGGIVQDLDKILTYCRERNLVVIEDAAHCLGSKWNGRELGTFGDLGCYSFHETKNITSGEGGAISVNNKSYVTTIETLREKGTDRSKFLRGEVDKYTWRSIGSSYLPSEITAAFLRAQLDDIDLVTETRRKGWLTYHQLLEGAEQEGLLHRPGLPTGITINGHIYYVILPSEEKRNKIISAMNRTGIQLAFHYVPLHSSPYGLKFKSDPTGMKITEMTASRLVRLPLWMGLTKLQQKTVCTTLVLTLRNM